MIRWLGVWVGEQLIMHQRAINIVLAIVALAALLGMFWALSEMSPAELKRWTG